MVYRKLRKYKYQLMLPMLYNIGVEVGDVDHGWITVIGNIVKIRKGYCWDGASGPVIDTPAFMRGSLIHDALYQLIRLDLIDKQFRSIADQTLYDICIADGMWIVKAKIVKFMVNKFGMLWLNIGKAEPKLLHTR